MLIAGVCICFDYLFRILIDPACHTPRLKTHSCSHFFLPIGRLQPGVLPCNRLVLTVYIVGT